MRESRDQAVHEARTEARKKLPAAPERNNIFRGWRSAPCCGDGSKVTTIGEPWDASHSRRLLSWLLVGVHPHNMAEHLCAWKKGWLDEVSMTVIDADVRPRHGENDEEDVGPSPLIS